MSPLRKRRVLAIWPLTCDNGRRGPRGAENTRGPADPSERTDVAKPTPRRCVRCTNDAEWKSQYCGPCKLARKVEQRAKFALVERERRKNPAIREAQRLAAADYRRRNPEKARASVRRSAKATYLRTAYGMTVTQVAAKAAAQNGRCAICDQASPLHIDHSHVSGTVRDLLCGNCNRGLGMFAESPERLLSAIAYLARHQPGDPQFREVVERHGAWKPDLAEFAEALQLSLLNVTVSPGLRSVPPEPQRDDSE